LRKNIILLLIVLSLGMAKTLSAAPTVSDGNHNFAAVDVSPSQESHFTYIPETSQINDISNSHFKAIGAEILKPPADFTYPQTDAARTLPPVPAGLFMTLTGFLCVSFVKDRRIWLAALAGLLWAGQAGVQVIPQLAVNISKKHIQQKSPINTVCLNRFEDYGRLRSDIEGTQYIGLLRHLAGIPERPGSLLLPVSPSPLRAQRSNLNVLLKNLLSARKSNITARQFAIIDLSSLLNPALVCPAASAEQNRYFSPAFTFQQLPRGPPNLN
jgi:hypothetical protein